MAPIVGGWEQAARLPAIDALAICDSHLKREALEGFRHALSCYHSILPGYAMGGGTPPDPPQVPPELEDED